MSHAYCRNLLKGILGIILISGVLVFITTCKQKEEANGSPEKITIAYAKLTHYALFQVAFAKGFFLAEGLDVTPQPHRFGKIALDSAAVSRWTFAR